MTINKNQYEEKLNKLYVPDISGDNDIPKKAVLGNQKVDIIFIPYGVISVGDWAFAHCMKLKEIWLPDTIKDFGRDVFLDDNRLEKIFVYSKKVKDEYTVYDDISELLAIAVKCFKKSDVYNLNDLGSQAWFEWFDTNLRSYIDEPDDAGFNPFLAGGEEDYEDPENDIEYYSKKQCEKKCGAIYSRIRVNNNEYINYYINYLKNHKEEALQFVLDKKQESYEYFKLYAENGLIDKDDISFLLDKFSDEDYIECKAYLIKYKEKHFDNESVWDMFSL